MKKNFGAQTYLYPLPVLIISTYNPDGTPDAMNAAAINEWLNGVELPVANYADTVSASIERAALADTHY